MVIVDRLLVREKNEKQHERLDHQCWVGKAGQGSEEWWCKDISDDWELAHEDRNENKDKGEDEEVACEGVKDSIEYLRPQTIIHLIDISNETVASVADEHQKDSEWCSNKLSYHLRFFRPRNIFHELVGCPLLELLVPTRLSILKIEYWKHDAESIVSNWAEWPAINNEVHVVFVDLDDRGEVMLHRGDKNVKDGEYDEEGEHREHKPSLASLVVDPDSWHHHNGVKL